MNEKTRNIEDDLDIMGRELGPRESRAAAIMGRVRKLPPLRPQVQQTFFGRTALRLAVGIAAAILFAVTLLLLLSTSQHAYAQVLQRVEKAQTMSCDLTIAKEETRLFVAGNLLRLELAEGSVTIGNRTTGKWVFFDPRNHTASTITMTRETFDLYALFHDFAEGNEKRLGNKELNGKKVTGFQMTRMVPDDGKVREIWLTTWVDSATSLPAEVEGSVKGDSLHATNFKWDQPLDEKLFSMAVPEGYKVQDGGGITADKLKPPPSTQEAAKLVLKAGVGVGDLKFGDDATRVTELFGKPESIMADTGWSYPSKGLWLTVSPKQGVIMIMVGSRKAYPLFNVNDFPGKLENGLGIGSAREEVEKVYGKPDRSDSISEDSAVLYYDHAYLWFMLYSGKVTQIYLNPSPAAFDGIRAKAAKAESQPASELP